MRLAAPSLACHPLSSLLAPVHSPVGGSSITQIRGESASTSRGYIADTRTSVINSRPRWRAGRASPSPPLRYPSLFVHLAPSVFSRSRTGNFVRWWRRAGGIVSGEYTQVVAAKISFRFPSCSATYCDPCLHAGVLDWFTGSLFLRGIPGKPAPRLTGNRCVLTLRWRAFKSSGFDGPPIFFRIAGATPRHFISASLWSDGWPATRLSRGFVCI